LKIKGRRTHFRARLPINQSQVSKLPHDTALKPQNGTLSLDHERRTVVPVQQLRVGEKWGKSWEPLVCPNRYGG
jgi:hypothetical protein